MRLLELPLLDLIQKMAAGGATIHGGTNPPRVEGFF